MSILKSALAAVVASGAVLAISATAFATTSTSASPSPSPTPTPIPLAGPLTTSLTCDTGPSGAGTFTVTANGKSSTVSVKCGKRATVSNAAWKVGSKAVIHQTAAATGALKARDVSITLKATANSVAIRNFRPASVAVTTTTLAQTGGGVPALPIGLALAGLVMAVIGAGVMTRRCGISARR